MKLFEPLLEMLKFQSKDPLPETRSTFQALVEAIIPATPVPTEEFLIWALDHYLWLIIVIKGFNIYLANATAEMLNVAARQLIDVGGNRKPVNAKVRPEEDAFAALDPGDRLRAITLLEQYKVDLRTLPLPFRNNAGFVLAIMSVITLLTTYGYYSEWSGIGWEQAGYPGPSKGHHALRGYLIKEFTK